MAGPHAHDDDKAHEVAPTDAPTAEIGLFFGFLLIYIFF